MKLIWHIIRKDIVRDRAALLTWALLFVGQDAIGLFARHTTGMNAERVTYLQVANGLLIFLQMTMGYFLVARLVQADVLIGTSMFWRTRPVSAGRLLAAKVLGALLLFALLPVLLLLPWWIYCQFGGREILWTAVNLVGWQLLMIAPAFLVASLTDDLGRVMLWTLLLVIGLTSWIVLLQSALGGLIGRDGGSVMFTRLWVCALMLIIGSFAIAAHYYLTRRFARSVGLVVFGLGLIALTGQVWPWNWIGTFATLHQPALAAVDPALVNHLAFTVQPARGTFGGGFKEKDVDKKEAALYLQLRLSGLPDDMGIRVDEFMKHTWSWSDDRMLRRTSGVFWSNNLSGDVVLRRTYALPIPVEDPETLRWRKVRRDRVDAERAARGMKPFFGGWYDNFRPAPKIQAGEARLNGYVNLPNSLLAKIKSEPPAYHAEARWLFYRPTVVAELPLTEGARTSGEAQTYDLRQMNGNKPLVVSTRPAITRMGVWLSWAVTSRYGNYYYRERVVLVNRVTGDCVTLRDGQTGSTELMVGGVVVNWNVLLLAPSVAIRNDQDVVADPQWREHSVLALLTDKDVGGFEHAVETAKFELEPEAPGKNP